MREPGVGGETETDGRGCQRIKGPRQRLTSKGLRTTEREGRKRQEPGKRGQRAEEGARLKKDQ